MIESAVLEKDEVIFKGEISACCISEYKNDLIFYTNGRSVCLTELKGYKEISGGFISQPHCPDRRLSFTNGESEATDGVMPHCSSRKNSFSFFGKRYIIKQWQIEDCGGNNGFFKR